MMKPASYVLLSRARAIANDGADTHVACATIEHFGMVIIMNLSALLDSLRDGILRSILFNLPVVTAQSFPAQSHGLACPLQGPRALEAPSKSLFRDRRPVSPR